MNNLRLSLTISSLAILLLFSILISPNSYGNSLYSQQPESIPPQLDMFVADGKPTQSFSEENGLWIGNWDRDGLNKRRTFLKFTLNETSVFSKTIASAKLVMYSVDTSGTVDVRIQRVDSEFNQTLTWTDQSISANFIVSPTVSSSGQPLVNTAETPPIFTKWEGDVSSLLLEWKAETNRNRTFAIKLASAQEDVSSYVGFVSTECAQNNCASGASNFAPLLIITYAEPAPNETFQPGETTIPVETVEPEVSPEPDEPEPSPTSTPEPTPGIKSISMTNAPTDTLNVGDIVTYTIHIENGEFPLTDLTIANPVPSKLEVITATLPVTATVNVENVVNWTIDNLAANQRTTASYQARVPIQKPTGLFIKGIAPFYTVPGPNKTYLLTVTNHSPITATQLVITSTIPNHIVVSSSSLSPADGTAILPPGDGRPTILEWAFSDFELAPSKQITVSFSGTILRDAVGSVILHDQYNVRAKQLDGSSFAPVEKPFDPISIVVHNSSPDIAPTQQYIPPVYATTACIFWEYLVTKINEKGAKCTTSPIANPAVNYIFAPLLYGQGVVDE